MADNEASKVEEGILVDSNSSTSEYNNRASLWTKVNW